MSGINADFTQDGNSVFENVYIHGILDHEFETLTAQSLTINGTLGNYISGVTTFTDIVYFEDDLNVLNLQVRQRFELGEYSDGDVPIKGNLVYGDQLRGNETTGFQTVGSSRIYVNYNPVSEDYYSWSDPQFANERLELGVDSEVFWLGIGTQTPLAVGVGNTVINPTSVGSSWTYYVPKYPQLTINANDDTVVVTQDGVVGIGTITPYGAWTQQSGLYSEQAQGALKLEVHGSVHVDRNIYDSVGSPGQNGYWLKRDERGIRWQPLPPVEDKEGIKVQDEGEFIPLVGVAQTFDTLNFRQGNSLGFGTDTLHPDCELPTFNTVINDRSGTITGSANTIGINTTSVLVGQIVICNTAGILPELTSVTDIIPGVGGNPVGVVSLSASNITAGDITTTFDFGDWITTGIATINTFDLWGHTGSGNTAPIFRQTTVGIGTTQPKPTTMLDIFSTEGRSAGLFSGSSLLPMLHISQQGSAPAFQVDDVGAGVTDYTPFVIRGDGNVGIRTDNPKQPFQFNYDENEMVVITSNGSVGVGGSLPEYGIESWRNVRFRDTLNVNKETTLDDTLDVEGKTTIFNDVLIKASNKLFDIQNEAAVTNFSVDTDDGNTYIKGTLTVDDIVKFTKDEEAVDSQDGGTLTITGGTGIAKKLFVGGIGRFENDLDSTSTDSGSLRVDGGVGVGLNLYVGGQGVFQNTTQSYNTNTGAVIIGGGVGIAGAINVGGGATVGGATTLGDVLELESHIRDKNNSIGVGVAKTDYRLSSVGSGVSWRPSGVQTKNTIWVSVNGLDTNSGMLEGDAKRTIGAAAAIAETGDTIKVRAGVYYENNPVGLRTEVTVSGEDLRLVTVVPNNVNKDVFQVRAGCLIQNLNFAGSSSPTNHVGCGAVAFPPTAAGVAGGTDFQAITGYTALGPANQGPDRLDPTKGGRYRSPYVRNCTNFMTGSIGMKINGDYVNAAFGGINDLGQDIKSMVCDSFTQYNENGIGVSLTNNAYAQLVSIFTIGCDIAIFAGSGGQCDLTNSNSSFGNFGLYADGVGDVEFIGTTDTTAISGQDSFILDAVTDIAQNYRKPFDGQGAYFHINMDDYADSPASGIVTQPLQLIRSLDIIDGGTGYQVGAPPNVTVQAPLGPESILPEFSANVSAAGSITSIDVIASGRNFLPDQELTVTFSSGNASATVNTDPILFTVDSATEPTNTGLTTVTFNEFIPYNVGAAVTTEFVRLSRVITSSHSFEYVGAGTDLNKANPFQGGEPVPENEIVAINGGQVPFTSTDQKGNFRIGDGLTIDQTTSTIRGRDFNRAIQAQLTPLILALR